MALVVDAERWCGSIAPATSNPPICCGDVAITLCDSCGVPLCEVHEIVCATCSASTCGNCQHACSSDFREDPILAA